MKSTALLAVLAAAFVAQAAAANPPMANLNLNADGELKATQSNTNSAAIQPADRTLTTNTNASSPATAENEQPKTAADNSAVKSKLRESAKLAPLLMIVVAVGLYMIYARLSRKP